jgi:hypothetical protein
MKKIALGSIERFIDDFKLYLWWGLGDYRRFYNVNFCRYWNHVLQQSHEEKMFMLQKEIRR